MKKLYPILAILLLSFSLHAQDQKLSALTLATPADDSLTYIVIDPSGTPLSRASTVANFRSYVPLHLNGSSATALTVGPNGTTNPTLTIATNTASGVTGLKVTTAAAGSGVTIASTSSGTDEDIKVSPKGAGVLAVNSGINVTGSSVGQINNITGDFYLGNYGGATQSTIIQIQGVNRAKFGGTAGLSFQLKDETSSTGITTGLVDAGAGQSTTDLWQFRSNGASVLSGVKSTGGYYSPTYGTSTNCTDSAGAAACGAAAAGSVVIDAAATTVVVSTTAVTANSQIFITEDSSLSTRLSVTCNSTISSDGVTARTSGTSFTITTLAAPVASPRCFSYFIVN